MQCINDLSAPCCVDALFWYIWYQNCQGHFVDPLDKTDTSIWNLVSCRTYWFINDNFVYRVWIVSFYIFKQNIEKMIEKNQIRWGKLSQSWNKLAFSFCVRLDFILCKNNKYQCIGGKYSLCKIDVMGFCPFSTHENKKSKV